MVQVAILGDIITLPFGPAISFISWATMAICYGSEIAGRDARFGVPLILFSWLFLESIPAISSSFALGVLFLFLARKSSSEASFILTQLGRALSLFSLVDLVLLKHPTVSLLLANGSHAVTRFVRHLLGDGDIVGFEIFGGRLLVFSVLVVVPICSDKVIYARHHWLFPLLQASMAIVLTPLRHIFGPEAYLALCISSAGLMFQEMSSGARVGNQPGKVARNVAFAFQFGSVLTLGAVVIWNGWLIKRESSSERSVDARRILFIDDSATESNSPFDMTSFERLDTASPKEEFEAKRSDPLYGVLARQLLPQIGYRVDVKSIASCSTAVLSDYDIVVLICIQHPLPLVSLRESLLSAVRAGTTNVLIAGDHTDIGGVQAPFNEFAGPLGVTLNYDSVFPFGGWESQLNYLPHPIHKALAYADRQTVRPPGMSVGGSLSLDWRVAFPLIIAADGYSDRGTPNAPQLAGLGERAYTANEPRGGLVLAAERPFGKGTIIAFGDTAFLQNSSVQQHFVYCASLFDYLSLHGHHQSSALQATCVIATCTLVLALIIRFSLITIAACLVLVAFDAFAFTTRASDAKLLERMEGPLVLVDNRHAIGVWRDEISNRISACLDLISGSTDSLVLATDALTVLSDPHERGSVDAIVLVSPEVPISERHRHALVDYVEEGGRLLVACGFYESRIHDRWLHPFDCEISPQSLGAGQNVVLEQSSFGFAPAIGESWKLELGPAWSVIVSAFKHPIIAVRDFKSGRVCVISDSLALRDRFIQVENAGQMRSESFTFYGALLRDFLSSGSPRTAFAPAEN
jgi:hypothetical protein